MGRNFWSSFKAPFHAIAKPFEAVEEVFAPITRATNTIEHNIEAAPGIRDVISVTHDINRSIDNTLDIARRHPLMTAAIVGTAVIGGAAIVLTGGLAAPEVAALEVAEVGAVVGTEVGVEAAVVGAEVSGAGAIELGDAAVIEAAAPEVVDTELAADLEAVDSQGTLGNPQLETELTSTSELVPIESETLSTSEQATLNELNEAAKSGNMVRFTRLSKQLLSTGQKGAKIIARVEALAGAGALIHEIVRDAKEIGTEKTTSGKIKKIGELINKSHKAAAIVSGKEITQLKKLGHTLEQVGGHINKIEKAGETLNVLAKKELVIEKNNLHTLKDIIKENRSETSAIKHSQVVLDNELQNLESEEKKEEDISMRIATSLDRPVSLGDFIKDIKSFNQNKSKVDYVVENYTQFISLPQQDMTTILDMLNGSNAIAVF